MNKGHVWDEVSVRMVKICDETLVPPLQIIFQFSSDTGTFPNYWKKGNLAPVHKKGDKWKVGNYRPHLFFPYYVKFLKSAFLTQFTVILSKTSYLHPVNLVFARMILVFISYYP